MATWAEFAAAEPDFATFGRDLLRAATPPDLHHDAGFTGYAFIATVRPDGGPRLHALCPIMAAGRLYIAVAPETAKLRDLHRDGRFMLHAFLGPSDTEFSLRGRAIERENAALRPTLEAAARGWTNLHDDEVIFELEIERADGTTWENVSQPDTRAVRRKWVAGE